MKFIGNRGRAGLMMRLAAVLLIAGVLTPAEATAVPPPRPKPLTDARLVAGLHALAEDDLDEAERQLAQADEPLARKLLHWWRLTRPGTDASFAELTGFIRDNPDWPYQLVLRRAAEAAAGTAPPADRLAWFERHPPLTADGLIAQGEALQALGRRDEAAEIFRRAWIEGAFTAIEERRFLARHGRFVRDEDHLARLDRLLWDGYTYGAQRQLMRVDRDHRLLAQARIALIRESWGVDAAVSRVPRRLEDDPGLVLERVRWRRRHDLEDSAIALLLAKGSNAGRPERWWRERQILARHALSRNKPELAYRLVEDHGQVDAGSFAEAEWLAGWIALRFLDRPQDARRHFERLYQRVSYPISLARGAYWTARASEAEGRADAALWYARAAEFDRTFYGQLALSRLQENPHPPLPQAPVPTEEEIEAFQKNEIVRLIRLLALYGRNEQVDIFVRHLGRVARTPGERVLAAQLAEQIGRVDLGVSLARTFELDGIGLVDWNFPTPDLAVEGDIEDALVLALVRQESGFRGHAVSRAGARGLMQLMPGTARLVARELNVAYSKSRLTQDPDFNLALGSAYLRKLLDTFDGSYVLALAAYNAGPARVKGWMKQFGDPRKASVDVVDWIESIPYGETRNYVQRVMEGLHVYRRRLGTVTSSLPFSRHLN